MSFMISFDIFMSFKVFHDIHDLLRNIYQSQGSFLNVINQIIIYQSLVMSNQTYCYAAGLSIPKILHERLRTVW